MKNSKPYIRTLTRSEMVRRACPGHGRVGRRLARRASETFGRHGYTHAQPANGPAEEPVALVPSRHPLAPVVEGVRDGRRRFGIRELAAILGGPIDCPKRLAALARAGLALYSCDNGTVELRATNPDAASAINASRCGMSRKGNSIRKVVRAFAPGRPVHRVGTKRLLDAGTALADWGIDSPDLLDRPRRVHLQSAWRLT